MLGLNYFKLKDLVWGTDIAFTYGPLGQLCTRIGWGEIRPTFLFFDIFIFINYFLLFFYSFKKSNNKIVTTLLIISLVVFYPFVTGSLMSIVLMSFLVFWIRMSLDEIKHMYYVFMLLIITLLFYIKFNTGLITFPLFYSAILYNFFKNKMFKKWLYIYSILPLLFIVLLSFPLNVNIFSYIKAGIELIIGYNEIMFAENTVNNSLLYSLILIGLLVLNE